LKLSKEIGGESSSIKAINAIDKGQVATNTQFTNENKKEEAQHQALKLAEASEAKKVIANQLADTKA